MQTFSLVEMPSSCIWFYFQDLSQRLVSQGEDETGETYPRPLIYVKLNALITRQQFILLLSSVSNSEAPPSWVHISMLPWQHTWVWGQHKALNCLGHRGLLDTCSDTVYGTGNMVTCNVVYCNSNGYTSMYNLIPMPLWKIRKICIMRSHQSWFLPYTVTYIHSLIPGPHLAGIVPRYWNQSVLRLVWDLGLRPVHSNTLMCHNIVNSITCDAYT